jgi:hypothetical protein
MYALSLYTICSLNDRTFGTENLEESGLIGVPKPIWEGDVPMHRIAGLALGHGQAENLSGARI